MSCCNCNKIRDEPEQKTEDSIVEVGILKIPESLYLAIEVLNGRHGTGEERKDSLGSKYAAVQEIVNTIAKLY